MAKYGPKAQEEVKEAMHEFKEGKLKSGGKSKKKVTNPSRRFYRPVSGTQEGGQGVEEKGLGPAAHATASETCAA